MLFSVEERLDDIKYNIDFGGRGKGDRGEGDRSVHYEKKGAFYRRVSTLMSLIVADSIKVALGIGNWEAIVWCSLT